MLLGFIAQLAIANQLGADQAGAFFYGANALLLLTVAAGLGSELILLRAVAAARHRHSPRDARNALAAAVLIGSIGTAMVLGLGGIALLASFTSALGPSAEPAVLGLTLTAVPAQLLVYLGAEFQRGDGRVGASQLVRFTIIPGVFLGLWALFQPSTAAATMGLYAIAAWVCALATTRLTLPRFPMFKTSADGPSVGHRLMNGIPIYVTGLSVAIAATAPTIAVGLWCNSADVSRFHIASQLTSLVGIILLSFNAVVAPTLVRYHTAGHRQAMAAYVRRITAIMAGIALIPIGILFFATEAILSLFGDGFSAGANLVRIMAVGQWVSVVTGPVGYLLLMTGHDKVMRNAVGGITLGLVVALGLIVPYTGVEGAAVIHAAAMVGNNVLLSVLVWHFLGIVVIPALPQPPLSNTAPQ